MFITIKSATLVGLEGKPVHVEVDITGSWPGFHIIGLPDAAIQEAKERIKTAWKNADFSFPTNAKIVINLAPADIKKSGTLYDLPMALGMYLSLHKKSYEQSNALFAGELALDGNTRYTHGILPLALFARKQGYTELFIPAVNAKEASVIPDITIYPVQGLQQLVHHIEKKERITPIEKTNYQCITKTYPYDMSDIKGQSFTKRALEIVASGGHNIVLSGPPGSGKTLLSRTLPSILPDMTLEECIEVTNIYSVSGLLGEDCSLMTQRPFRSPHHTASSAAIIGGGKIPKPGEISLAHRGVLFLDEFAEFSTYVIESLRQPLEDGIVTVSRVQGTITYPAECITVMSINPCPCGFLYDDTKQCVCSAQQIERYHKKMSGPILDRMDLYVEVPKVPIEQLRDDIQNESSSMIKQRVDAAREKQKRRFEGTTIQNNSEMKNKDIQQFCNLQKEAELLLQQAANTLDLSARSYYRIIKVAQTIADLDDSQEITKEHVGEALLYRQKKTKP